VTDTRTIFCCECKADVDAHFITGKTAYPHRPDLFHKKFWQCQTCLNFVGTHAKGTSRKPLGCIPNNEMKTARMKIHAVIDPVWKSRRMSRKEVYQSISEFLGYEYHTGEIRDLETAKKIYSFAKERFL
jgi:hypothetical protein